MDKEYFPRRYRFDLTTKSTNYGILQLLQINIIRIVACNFVAFMLYGCAIPERPPYAGSVQLNCQDAAKAIPQDLIISFEMKEYRVNRDIVKGAVYPITSLKLIGHYVLQDSVFAKLDFSYANKCSSDQRFYLVEIPNSQYGTFDRRASLIDPNVMSIQNWGPELPPPLTRFTLAQRSSMVQSAGLK